MTNYPPGGFLTETGLRVNYYGYSWTFFNHVYSAVSLKRVAVVVLQESFINGRG